MRSSDWSSDVCSSDLAPAGDERGAIRRDVHAIVARPVDREGGGGGVELHRAPRVEGAEVERDVAGRDLALKEAGPVVLEDRTSGVEGKSGSVRVSLGGRSSITTKTTTSITNNN